MKTKIKKLYDSKAFWMIVSLIVSLGIWVYVSSVEGEEFKRTFSAVEVRFEGESQLRENRNLVITDKRAGSVRIEVVGPRRVVAGLDEAKLYARIDVSNLSNSAFTSLPYTVVFPDGTDTSNLRVTRKTPESVGFMVSKQTTKVVPVRGEFNGSMAEDVTAEPPVFEPATITVSGPEAYLKNVEYAGVSFGRENVDSTYETEINYTLMSADNQPCDTTEITAEPSTVTARLQVMLHKEVTLGVNLVYGAGATEENTVVTIEPSSVKLAGDSKQLDGLNKINLATINLTEFATSFGPEEYKIPIDDSLKNTIGVSEAKVTVEVIGLETKTFRVTNIDYTNLSEGMTATVETESLEVRLRGSPESIAQINEESIRAVADLSEIGESTGTFMPKVRIYVDGFTDVGAISTKEKPLTVTVSIERAAS